MENELTRQADGSSMLEESTGSHRDKLMAARDNLRNHIRAFLEDNTIYNLMPTNAELPVVDSEMSVLDVIEVYRIEDKSFCLYWSSEKQRVEGIHLMIDFINFVLSLDLKHFTTNMKAASFLGYVSTLRGSGSMNAIVYPTDSLRDVVQKFLLNKGQNVYLDQQDRLIGVISISDIINYLL